MAGSGSAAAIRDRYPPEKRALVEFAIRTRRQFFRSTPNMFLVAMAFAAVAVAVTGPLLPLGAWFGFVAPPKLFFVYLFGATVAYLTLVEFVKGIFYRFNAKR
jgi:Mg2+-importing ATPase